VPALPPGLTYVEIATGGAHTVARRSDGSVVAWGDNGFGQCNVPALPPGLFYVDVAAGERHTLARRSDGSVVAWGRNLYGESNVPALAPGLCLQQIAAGYNNSVALLRNGAYTTFAAGCPGSAGVTRLEPITLPRVGGTMSVRVEPLPQSIALMITGLSNVSSVAGPLPLDATSFGLTNCALRVSPDFTTTLNGSAASAGFTFAVPPDPALAGLIAYQQALVLDASAGNPAGFVLSDAATLVVGR
jgi:hypothetical protein